MNLEDLKQKLERKEKIDNFIIFVYSDTDFVPIKYIEYYSDYINKEIVYVDDIEHFNSNVSFMIDDSIYIYRCDEFDIKSERFKDINDLFVVCKKINSDTKKIYSDNIVDVPELEKWQIYDYIKFKCPTLAENFKFMIDTMDIYSIDNEISKISIFSKNLIELDSATALERDLPKYVYKSLINDGSINYISKYTIYDLVNGLITSNKSLVNDILKYDIDIDLYELYYNLYNTVKQIIQIVIDRTSSADSLGIPSGRYWAIKYSYGSITKERAAYLIRFLDEFDRLLKSGLDDDKLFGYLIINCLKR